MLARKQVLIVRWHAIWNTQRNWKQERRKQNIHYHCCEIPRSFDIFWTFSLICANFFYPCPLVGRAIGRDFPDFFYTLISLHYQLDKAIC